MRIGDRSRLSPPCKADYCIELDFHRVSFHLGAVLAPASLKEERPRLNAAPVSDLAFNILLREKRNEVLKKYEKSISS